MDFPRYDNDDAKQKATKEAQHGASLGMHVLRRCLCVLVCQSPPGPEGGGDRPSPEFMMNDERPFTCQGFLTRYP